MTSFIRIVAVLSIPLAAAGCTNRQVYNSLQGSRLDECSRMADASIRARCFADAGKSYEQYEKDRAY